MNTWIRAAIIPAVLTLAGPVQAADTVRIALPPPYAPMVTAVVAQQEGYFKEKDIEVTITNYRGGAAAQEAIAANAADVGAVSSPGAAIAIQKGVKQKIVANAGPTSPRGWMLLVPTDSPIKTVRDLADKKIGITGKGSTTDFFAAAAAKDGNAKFQAIPLGAGILPALKAKQVDAGVLWPVVSYQSVQSGQYRIVSDFGESLRNITMDVWVVSQEMIDRKPEVVRRWLDALVKALQKLQSDEKFAIAALGKFLDTTDEPLLKATYAGIIKPMRTDHLLPADALDRAIDLAEAGGLSGLLRSPQILDARFTGPAK